MEKMCEVLHGRLIITPDGTRNEEETDSRAPSKHKT